MNPTTHRPFLYVGGAFASGIFLSRFAQFSPSVLCIVTVVFLILGAGLLRGRIFSTALLLLAITSLGIIYTQTREYVPENDIEYVARYYRKKPVSIEGVIVSDISERKSAFGAKTAFTIDIARVQAKWGWQKRKGKVLVNIFGATKFSYGDHIRLEGKLHRPYNFSSETNFSYRKHLSRRGIRFILSVKKARTWKCWHMIRAIISGAYL
jgi:hypothetical protein